MYILTYFCQKSSLSTSHADPPPFLLNFTAIIDYLRAGEVPLGYGPHSGAAPFRIPIRFRSRATESGVAAGLQLGPLFNSF
jgi:hypothetical protein